MNELDNLLSAMKINDEDSVVSIRLKHLRRVQGDSCQPDYERLQSDKLASMLIPSEINVDEGGQQALKCTGNGNCLYNSASLVLCGDEHLSTSLRILTACELFRNGQLYTDHPALETVIKNPEFMSRNLNDARAMIFPTAEISSENETNVRNVALSTCTDRAWSGLIHIMALATVLQRPIYSVYPEVNMGIRPLFNNLFYPVSSNEVNEGHIEIMYIMWSRDGNFDTRDGALFEPNHFVPLVKKQTSVHQKRKLSESPQKSRKKVKQQKSISSFFQKKNKTSEKQTEGIKPSTFTAYKEKSILIIHNETEKMDIKSDQSDKTSTLYEEKCQVIEDKDSAEENSNKESAQKIMEGEIVQEEKQNLVDTENTEFIDSLADESCSEKTALADDCADICCTGNTPFQPRDKAILQQTKVTIKRKNKTITRAVQGNWFDDFPWLTLCTTRKNVFCFFCRKAVKRKVLMLSKNAELAFSKNGFSNWKKAMNRFREHENSSAHKEAELNIRRLQSGAMAVSEQIEKKEKEDQKKRRLALSCKLSSLKFLLRQGLAVRGHSESEGHLTQLLKLRAEDNPTILSWIEKGRYVSPEIVNEQISLIGLEILRSVLDDVRQAKWFSIMADETMDVAYKEQLVVCVRWVDDSFNIHEDMLGLFEIHPQTSDFIALAVKDVLIRSGLPLELCRGQAYDGAPNMSGHLTGVAKQIQNQYPSSISVHCFAHCINLSVQDVTKKCSAIRDSMDLVTEIEKLICLSPKRKHLFMQKKLQETNLSSPNLRPICPTRWTVRTYAIESVIQNYKVLQDVLDDIHTNTNDEYSRRAGGQLAMMEKFSTYFGLKLSHLIFAASEQLSISIQGKNTSAQDAIRASKATVSYFERQRNDSVFSDFYDAVCAEAKDLTDEPSLPRYRRAPKRLDDGSNPHRYDNPKDYFKQQFFEALEQAVGTLENRFEQKNMTIVKEIESLLLNAANGELFSVSEEIAMLYKDDISFPRLEQQLKMLPDIFKVDSENEIKKVTLIDTICQHMKEPITKKLLSEVTKLVQIYLTIPVTTATPERSFSSLRRIKTYLRSTMTQARLNHCMTCFVHKERTDQVNIKEIAKSFIQKIPSRKLYFGNY